MASHLVFVLTSCTIGWGKIVVSGLMCGEGGGGAVEVKWGQTLCVSSLAHRCGCLLMSSPPVVCDSSTTATALYRWVGGLWAGHSVTAGELCWWCVCEREVR